MPAKNHITGECRASYAHVWEMSKLPNNKMAYNLALLIPKTDQASIQAIKASVNEAATIFFGEDKKKWPPALVSPLHDGDAPENMDKPDTYRGHHYLNAKSDRQPGIVGPDAKPIMDQEEFYSGVYCRASVNFYGYNKGGNRGVGVGLNNLMKTRDGDRLDGRKTAEHEFSEFATETPQEAKDDFLE